MYLIKAKYKSKHLSKNIVQCRRLQKLNFVGLMMRFNYFLNHKLLQMQMRILRNKLGERSL